MKKHTRSREASGVFFIILQGREILLPAFPARPHIYDHEQRTTKIPPVSNPLKMRNFPN